MMSKSKKIISIIVLCVAFFCLAALGACKQTGDDSATDSVKASESTSVSGSFESERPASVRPTITVDTTALSGKLAEEIALPNATANDDTDGDLTDKISVTVYFARDTLTVYEATDGAAEHKFTPSRVGEYTVIYKVANSRNKTARQEVTLNVADNPDAVSGSEQLVANKENWTMTDDNKFDEDDYLRVKSIFGTSVAYGGRKIANADTIAFRFSANPGKEMFYSVNAWMSSSYKLDAPIKTESNNGFPPCLTIRVSANKMEIYFGSHNNDNFPFDGIDKKVLDGKDHTMALRATLSGDKLKFEIWVDADPAATRAYGKEVTKAEMIEHYGEEKFNAYFADMFDEEKFGGYFNIGSYDGDGKGYLTLKAFSINGEQHINEPALTVNSEVKATYILNEEIEFPSANAEDSNSYSDLTSRVKAIVVTPSGESVELENYKYTPAETGRYVLRYLVVDYSGNKSKKTYEFSVTDVMNTEAPSIVFGDEVSETINAKAGEAFALPVPQSVTDERGTDISKRLKVELVGKESADVTGKETITLYSVGKHIIRYSATDDSSLTGVKELTVNVEGLYAKDKNLADKTTYVSNSEQIYTENGITVKSTGKLAGQKVYDEKITFKIKGNLVGSFIYINIRGGKNLNEPDNLGLDWNSGLIIKITCALGANGNFSINYGGHDQNAAEFSVPSEFGKSLAQLVADGMTLSVQATDVLDDDGNVKQVSVKMWVNDVLVTPEEGRIFDSSFIKKNPDILSAGWLTVSAYDYGEDADLTKIFIEEMYVDDGMPHSTENTGDTENKEDTDNTENADKAEYRRIKGFSRRFPDGETPKKANKR